MSDIDFYTNSNGDTVFTSDYYRKKGRCCKNCCLHCPYGTTLKKFGLEFEDFDDSKRELAQTILKDANQESFDLSSYAIERIKFVKIKDSICALICVDHLFVRELFHCKHFSNQGLNREIIESYYFY